MCHPDCIDQGQSAAELSFWSSYYIKDSMNGLCMGIFDTNTVEMIDLCSQGGIIKICWLYFPFPISTITPEISAFQCNTCALLTGLRLYVLDRPIASRGIYSVLFSAKAWARTAISKASLV